MPIRIGLVCALTLALTACEDTAVFFTPAPQAKVVNSPLRTQAENTFWLTLHQGQYNNIPQAEKLLMAAYLQNPHDPVLAAHIAFLHIWQITERQRLNPIPPTIVDQIILSQHYFATATQLNSADARYLGFLGDSQLINGKISQNQQTETKGYFTLKNAINAWPEFNYFTAGYVMSTLPADSPYFKQGLEWQWRTMDICANTHIDRNNPSYAAYMKLETQQGSKRACWNSWIAPFNFEGFFLNMGDMLVKSGDPATAVKIYQNAKLANNYQNWPYRKLLEQHMKDAKQNIKNFQANDAPIMLNSGRGCMACHQETAAASTSQQQHNDYAPVP